MARNEIKFACGRLYYLYLEINLIMQTMISVDLNSMFKICKILPHLNLDNETSV